MNLPAQSLFTCPRCGRSGFYARGLLAHVCRGTHFLDARRRLTPKELVACRMGNVLVIPEAATALRSQKGGVT